MMVTSNTNLLELILIELNLEIEFPFMVSLGSPNINLCLKYIYIEVVRLVSKGQPNPFNKSKSKLSITMIIFEGFDDDVWNQQQLVKLFLEWRENWISIKFLFMVNT